MGAGFISALTCPPASRYRLGSNAHHLRTPHGTHLAAPVWPSVDRSPGLRLRRPLPPGVTPATGAPRATGVAPLVCPGRTSGYPRLFSLYVGAVGSAAAALVSCLAARPVVWVGSLFLCAQHGTLATLVILGEGAPARLGAGWHPGEACRDGRVWRRRGTQAAPGSPSVTLSLTGAFARSPDSGLVLWGLAERTRPIAGFVPRS